MKRLLIGIVLVTVIAAAGLFITRQALGWNDGLHLPRSEIHATLLDNRIYVAGGIGLFRVLDSCEQFHLKTRSWHKCPSLPRPLHHVAMTADNTRVYASGGYVALPFEQDQEAALFALDLKSKNWIELSRLPHPIGQHAMTFRNGKIYLIGGQNGETDLSTVWAYDVNGDKWNKMEPMPTSRHSHAIAIDKDKLYVTGGRSASLGTEISKAEVYDFTTNTWQALPDMPTGRGGHGAFVRSGKLHVFGGESLTSEEVLSSHDIYDLEKGTWSKGKDMEYPRHGFAVAVADSGDNIIIGGGAQPGFQTIYSVTGTTQVLAD